MIHNPDIQVKAQQELDAVVSNQRLPEMQDQDDLPYIGRVVKEVFCWQPVGPLGVPHVCAKDDAYRGYFIPKEAVVAMCSNPETYPNPEKFDPDRFKIPTTPDPPTFGFGRRSLPMRSYFWPLLQRCLFSTSDPPKIVKKTTSCRRQKGSLCPFSALWNYAVKQGGFFYSRIELPI
ncbi:cytochrome P450 domain-containing protein [Rhizoctonia solani AG-1 IA]|uniref:Cytochrome P450 domain-containing protein n=1 Tax=Thanatephorus cucumeris (strain AG1-IA) TaxID=983506 RepID=L8WLS2_THACA|nr:cytochrome P450 domain-containing protein [Rhizoctonia solani AG-1 IA]